MGIAAILVILIGIGVRMVYITSSNAYWRRRTNATARSVTTVPEAMTQEEIDDVCWRLAEIEAHRDYTVAASSGQLPDIKLPTWKRVGGALLVGDLAYRAVTDVGRHLHDYR